MAYNTGNPIGSTDARDLLDNATNLDKAVNSPAARWTDRLGVSRPSWAGMVAYADRGAYAAGIEITGYNEIFLHEGEYYRAAASTTLPYTTTGSWSDDGNYFVSIGDATLRSDLATGMVGAINGIINVAYFGTLESARTSAEAVGKTIVVTTALTEAQSNITGAWPADRALKFENGGSIANSTAFTITSPFSAGLYQVFVGSGLIAFGSGSVQELHPEWWGAKADGVVDCSPAIQKAINASLAIAEGPNSLVGFSIGLQSGKYRLGSQLLINHNGPCNLLISGKYGTVLLSDNANGAIKITTLADIPQQYPNRVMKVFLRDFNITTTAAQFKVGVGLQIRYFGYMRLDNLDISCFATALKTTEGSEFFMQEASIHESSVGWECVREGANIVDLANITANRCRIAQCGNLLKLADCRDFHFSNGDFIADIGGSTISSIYSSVSAVFDFCNIETHSAGDAIVATGAAVTLTSNNLFRMNPDYAIFRSINGSSLAAESNQWSDIGGPVFKFDDTMGSFTGSVYMLTRALATTTGTPTFWAGLSIPDKMVLANPLTAAMTRGIIGFDTNVPWVRSEGVVPNTSKWTANGAQINLTVPFSKPVTGGVLLDIISNATPANTTVIDRGNGLEWAYLIPGTSGEWVVQDFGNGFRRKIVMIMPINGQAINQVGFSTQAGVPVAISYFAIYTGDNISIPPTISIGGGDPNTNPNVGTSSVRDRIFNIAPTVGQPKSWVCTAGGTPGTWVSEGNL